MLEVSTGIVACEREADARRPVGSTVKLMTALLTLERADLGDTFTAADYRPAAAESKIGLHAGRADDVRDLLRGLLIESGNDAAMTLAKGVAGSERRVRAADEPARAPAGAGAHALRQPDRARRAGRATPAPTTSSSSPLFLRTKPFFRRTVKQDERHADDRRRPAHVRATATR